MKSRFSILRFAVVFLLLGAPYPGGRADAHTWRVTPSENDTEQLRVVMNSTSPGDTVLFAPGEYEIWSVNIANGVVVTSELGPRQTLLAEYPFPGAIGGFSCRDLSRLVEISGISFESFSYDPLYAVGVYKASVRISDCVFRNNTGYAGLHLNNGSLDVTNCVFSDNIIGIDAEGEGNLRVSNCVFTNNSLGIVGWTSVWFKNNTFTNNVRAFDCQYGNGQCSSSIIWDSSIWNPSMMGYCNDTLRMEDVPPLWHFANFSLDPQFCGNDDFHIAATSPCAPGNNPIGTECELVGALPVNCSTTAVEERTWGQIKAMYRKQP